MADTDDKPGILDFLFGRAALKKAVGDTRKPQSPSTHDQSNSTISPHDYLRDAIAANPNNKPPEPDPTAVKILAAPSKNSRKNIPTKPVPVPLSE